MKAPIADKETLHQAIRAAVEANGGKRVSYEDFLTGSGMGARDIFHHYPKWQEALAGAGFSFQPYNSPLVPGEVLAEWGGITRNLGRQPTYSEYVFHGMRDAGSVGRIFGSWSGVADAFRRFAGQREEWADVIALMDSPAGKKARPRRSWKKGTGAPARPVPRLRERGEYGEQLDFPSLRHAPSNESGVIYLFGMLAERMGFAVERMQNAFPDCFAKRRVGRDGKWQGVAIEFEYESRNFRTHGHDPEGCDMIVCWVHNWPDCPENLEVIALSEEIKRMASNSIARPLQAVTAVRPDCLLKTI